MQSEYPARLVVPLKGSEVIVHGESNIASVLDFWRWAHSDLISNVERSKFAEFLVALAMGCAEGTSDEWAPYDILVPHLVSPDGFTIEVKTSAYLQTWVQNSPSRLVFSIKPSHYWDYQTNMYEDEVKRQADVYVFCVENCQNPSLLDPLDLDQWDFYPLATRTLDKNALGAQKSVSLTTLLKWGAVRVGFSELRESIIRQASHQKGLSDAWPDR